MRSPLVKMYDYAKERKKSLTSVIKNTILDCDEKKNEQGRISNGSAVKRRAVGCNREDNGKRKNKSGRGCQTNRRREIQCQQNHAPKSCCELGLSCENSGEYWFGSGIESQKYLKIDMEDVA